MIAAGDMVIHEGTPPSADPAATANASNNATDPAAAALSHRDTVARRRPSGGAMAVPRQMYVAFSFVGLCALQLTISAKLSWAASHLLEPYPLCRGCVVWAAAAASRSPAADDKPRPSTDIAVSPGGGVGGLGSGAQAVAAAAAPAVVVAICAAAYASIAEEVLRVNFIEFCLSSYILGGFFLEHAARLGARRFLRVCARWGVFTAAAAGLALVTTAPFDDIVSTLVGGPVETYDHPGGTAINGPMVDVWFAQAIVIAECMFRAENFFFVGAAASLLGRLPGLVQAGVHHWQTGRIRDPPSRPGPGPTTRCSAGQSPAGGTNGSTVGLRRPSFTKTVGVATMSAGLVSAALKCAVPRPRPHLESFAWVWALWWWEGAEVAMDGADAWAGRRSVRSFPSSHVALAAAAACVAWDYLGPARQQKSGCPPSPAAVASAQVGAKVRNRARRVVRAVVPVVVVFMAMLSVVKLRMHWLSDSATVAAIGLAMARFVLAVGRPELEEQKRDRPLADTEARLWKRCGVAPGYLAAGVAVLVAAAVATEWSALPVSTLELAAARHLTAANPPFFLTWNPPPDARFGNQLKIHLGMLLVANQFRARGHSVVLVSPGLYVGSRGAFDHVEFTGIYQPKKCWGRSCPGGDCGDGDRIECADVQTYALHSTEVGPSEPGGDPNVHLLWERRGAGSEGPSALTRHPSFSEERRRPLGRQFTYRHFLTRPDQQDLFQPCTLAQVSNMLNKSGHDHGPLPRCRLDFGTDHGSYARQRNLFLACYYLQCGELARAAASTLHLVHADALLALSRMHATLAGAADAGTAPGIAYPRVGLAVHHRSTPHRCLVNHRLDPRRWWFLCYTGNNLNYVRNAREHCPWIPTPGRAVSLTRPAAATSVYVASDNSSVFRHPHGLWGGGPRPRFLPSEALEVVAALPPPVQLLVELEIMVRAERFLANFFSGLSQVAVLRRGYSGFRYLRHFYADGADGETAPVSGGEGGGGAHGSLTFSDDDGDR